MIQTLALLVDAYRELNARKMFWISMILSGVIVALFAMLGVDDHNLTLFGIKLPFVRYYYKWTFSVFVIGVWIKWGALILALISTASIFPDLLTSGSIDLYLARPISRLRLFATKYAGGLLFVLLQTVVFAACSFLVFRLRVHEWRAELFLMVPLVGLLYSYLFCVCTLIGILTRSTIAAILLTVLFWAICFGINLSEYGLFFAQTLSSIQVRLLESQVRQSDSELKGIKGHPSILDTFGLRRNRIQRRRTEAQQSIEAARSAADKWRFYHQIAYGVATFIPKTGETVDLMDRLLFTDKEMADERDRQDTRRRLFEQQHAAVPDEPATKPSAEQAQEEEQARAWEEQRQMQRETEEEAMHYARSRSVPWIIGTSLGFEAVILAWSGWVFQRRDY